MKKLKSMLVTLAMLLCTISASAEDFSVDGIYYKITDSEKLTVAVVSKGNSSEFYSGNIVIPESVTYDGKTYAVTSIGEYAFQYCQGITSLVIPNSVVSIGYYAFEQCINLSSIDLGNNVTSIGFSAFSWCKSLESIVIPNGVSSIESTTFNMCTKLSSVTMGNNVTSIGNYAFNECSSLASVSIPNSVTSIGQGAFNGTAWYNNQPDGVLYINKIAYTYKGTMPSNTSITLKDGTTIISEYAFYNCTNLTSIIIPNSVASIGEYAFSGSGLTSINIPNSIVSINNNTFYGCNSLLSVIISDGVKYIGEYAFDSCANLESISIPSSVEVIDGNAFMGCAKLASLYISDITAWLKIDFKSLYSHPTRDCAIYSLTSLYLNDELVTELTIPNEITSIPNFALCGISSLASVVIPNTVSKIGSEAFSMSGLTSITIPNSITSIESYTFDCCSKLVSVTIPNSVKNIGYSAFYGCTSLENISIYANTPPTVESSSTFENYNIDILVPASAVETYRSTQPWSNFTSIKALPLEILEIKNSISTFCSNSDLDFTSVSDLKAYIASGYNKNTGKVMLSRVYDVPAGTGLLLIGETGNYEVPITTSASCYSNFLKGVTTATTITPTSDGYNNYILANGTNGIGFYPVGEEGTLAAGKAYLQMPSSVSSAKGFSLSFKDETTGISDNYEVEIMNSDAAVYDLQGRKVNNPTKGLYIVNGKKVLIK